jgi:hypothetical protein
MFPLTLSGWRVCGIANRNLYNSDFTHFLVVKTVNINLDTELVRKLKSLKKHGESLDDVINRILDSLNHKT